MTTAVRARAALVVPAVVGVLALLGAAGCSSDTDAESSTETDGRAATGAGASPSAAADPVLEVDPSGESASCSPRSRRGDRTGFWGPTVTATGDLRITGASLEGDGLRLLGVDGVVSSMPDDDRESGIDDRWPITDRVLRSSAFDLTTRVPIDQMQVAAGTQVLPVVGVRNTQPDVVTSAATMQALRLDYTWGDGSRTASVVVPYDYSFAQGAC